jgi:hypothetical protein
MIDSCFDKGLWEDIYVIIEKALYELSSVNIYNDYKSLVKSMYVDKTERYFKELSENFKEFGDICSHECLTINGKRCLNFVYVWDDIKKIIEKELLDLDKLQIIHGDMCFSNILCGINTKTDTCLLKFVDPRGSFGRVGIFGDPQYDYAKLYHSFNGCYEYIIFDKFKLSMNGDLSKFDYTFINENYKKIEDVFKQNKLFVSRNIKLICGLIFIGMCSRHYDSLQRQIVMYCTGITMLNDILN